MTAKIEEKLHRNKLFDSLKKYVAVTKHSLFFFLQNIVIIFRLLIFYMKIKQFIHVNLVIIHQHQVPRVLYLVVMLLK
jgi:hypothetical protein